MNGAEVFSINLSLDLGGCSLLEIVFDKILLYRGSVISLIASILDLSCSRFLCSISLILSHLFGIVFCCEAWVTLYIRLISLIGRCVVKFRATNVEVSLTKVGHVWFDHFSIFASECSRVGGLTVELWVKLWANWKVLLARHLPHIFHCLLDTGWIGSCGIGKVTELILGRWNRFEFFTPG